MKTAGLATVLAIAVGGFEFAQTDKAFQELSGLVGTWRIAGAPSPGRSAFRISYRMISADTALVEEFGNPAKQTTETIYHRDGDNLMATHYCAQGNQPRLRLQQPNGDNALEFRFFDATNLKSVKDSHLVRLRFEFIDGQHFKREEVYAAAGREEASSLVLERVQ